MLTVKEDQAAFGWVAMTTGMYLIHRGAWNEAEETLAKGVEVAGRIGELRRMVECAGFWASMLNIRGDFSGGIDRAHFAYTSAFRRRDSYHQFHMLVIQAQSYLRQGQPSDLDTAHQLMVEAESQLNDTTPDFIRYYGVLAEVHLRRGNLDLARESAELTLEATKKTARPQNFYVFVAYAGVSAVMIALWQAADEQSPDHKTLQEAARQSCKNLWTFAQVFPFSKPRAHLWQGVYHWLDGHPQKAHKHWRKCVQQAQKLQMPYDEALAYYQMGCHSIEGDLHRRENLNKAIAIFERLGAFYDLQQAEDALQ